MELWQTIVHDVLLLPIEKFTNTRVSRLSQEPIIERMLKDTLKKEEYFAVLRQPRMMNAQKICRTQIHQGVEYLELP